MEQGTKEEKIALAEFLYRDNELIESLYSQIFGGDLCEVTKSNSFSSENDVAFSTGFKIMNTNHLSKDINLNQLSKNIVPKDAKILELLEKIDTKNSDDSNLRTLNNGSLVRFEGDLIFNNFDLFSDMLNLLNEAGQLPDVFKDIPTKNKKNNVKKNNELAIEIINKVIPSGIEFELVTNEKKNIICCIDENYLSNNIKTISKNYRYKCLGKWVVYGILDLFEDDDSASENQGTIDFYKMVDDIGKELFKMTKQSNRTSLFLRPIVIYRQLHY